MKRFLVVMFTLASLTASAQAFKLFKVNLSVGYAKPLGSGFTQGALVSVEPKFGLSDHVDLGLRFETAAVMGEKKVDGTDENAPRFSGLGSGLLTGTYLFSTRNFRPYIGAGVGVYSVAGTSVTITDKQKPNGYAVNLDASTKFGGMVRVGFKVGHLNLGVEYNLVPATTITDSLFGTVENKNDYVGAKLGFDIGGGRRK